MTSATDSFMKYERMEGRVLTIDGAEFADTREKLEADVRMTLNDSDDWHAWVQYHTALEWLDRQAAITERECMERATSERVGWDCAECAEGLGKELDRRCDPLKARIADLQAQLEEVTRAYKERGRIIAELREQLRNDDEPFCETVKRWLSKDAPEECLECEDGCWRDMHELMARECDSCEPMQAAEREIRELKKKYENLLEYRTKVNCDCDCCNWHDERDRMQKVIETQAESFQSIEREVAYWKIQMRKCLEASRVGNIENLLAYPPNSGLTEPSLMVASVVDELRDYAADYARKYEEQKRRLSDKQQENANQREELARFNAVRRRTKRIPKACVWPRKDNGKLLKPGRDCMSITFYRDHYDVDYGDGEHLWCSFKVARENERAWIRGED